MPEPRGASGAVRVEPGWSLFITYTVSLLDAPTHRHGPKGAAFVSYKDAVELLHRCIKAHQKPETEARGG